MRWRCCFETRRAADHRLRVAAPERQTWATLRGPSATVRSRTLRATAGTPFAGSAPPERDQALHSPGFTLSKEDAQDDQIACAGVRCASSPEACRASSFQSARTSDVPSTGSASISRPAAASWSSSSA